MIDSEELKVMIFLRSKDLGEIADGTEKCPTETTEKN